MKKLFKVGKGVTLMLLSMVMALFIGVAAESALGLNAYATAGLVFAGGVVMNIGMPQVQGMAYAIQQEFWVDYIIGNLFKDNEFASKCFDESSSVLNGSVVHINQSGAKPTVIKNRSSYPATAVRRTDTDITYALDVYTTDPTHIPLAEELEVSYDKMNDVLGEHIETLKEYVYDDLLYNWAPTAGGQILRTTGAAASDALAPGATGTRLTLLASDIKRARTLMNKQNIPKTDRYILLPSDLYAQLFSDTTLLARDYAGEIDLKNGTVLSLFGFNVMERAETTVYTTGLAPKAIGAATAVTDNLAAICWQKNQVCRALGTVTMFENKKDALYFGDIYSMLLKCGSRKRRSSGYGVVAIVQA